MVSDYGEQRQAARRAVNAKNKSRSKAMELRIMKYLKGKRVPMSGSGSIKGDGQILSDKGYVLVECKHSAVSDRFGRPTIYIPFHWFAELEKDSKSMNAALSVLVFHYLDARMRDYAILPADTYNRLSGGVITHVVDQTGKKGWRVSYNYLEEHLKECNSVIGLMSAYGLFVIMRLPYFRDLIHGEDSDE